MLQRRKAIARHWSRLAGASCLAMLNGHSALMLPSGKKPRRSTSGLSRLRRSAVQALHAGASSACSQWLTTNSLRSRLVTLALHIVHSKTQHVYSQNRYCWSRLAAASRLVSARYASCWPQGLLPCTTGGHCGYVDNCADSLFTCLGLCACAVAHITTAPTQLHTTPGRFAAAEMRGLGGYMDKCAGGIAPLVTL